jgi:hypothetical protein
VASYFLHPERESVLYSPQPSGIHVLPPIPVLLQYCNPQPLLILQQTFIGRYFNTPTPNTGIEYCIVI